MIPLLCFVLAVLASPCKSKSRLEAENAALRHQLIVLRRKMQGRVRLTNSDRRFLIRRATSSAIGIGFMAALSHAECAPWASETSLPHRPHLGRMACRTVDRVDLRECVDHFIVLGEAHLRHILRTYARYYNHIRTHWSLDKDTPVYRPVQHIGSINSHAILGGLHHHYVRV